MKSAVLALCLVILAVVTGGASTSDRYVLAGVSRIGKQQLFVLYDAAAKEPSSWMKIGESWKGITLQSYDDENEVLTIKIGETVGRLRLKEAKVLDDQSLPRMLKGSSKVVGETIIYSAGSEVQIAPKFIVTATKGEMTFDAKENVLRGDLVIDTGEDFLVVADAGMVRMKNGRPIVSAKKLVRLKTPNKAPEPTPGSVTPRADDPKMK